MNFLNLLMSFYFTLKMDLFQIFLHDSKFESITCMLKFRFKISINHCKSSNQKDTISYFSLPVGVCSH